MNFLFSYKTVKKKYANLRNHARIKRAVVPIKIIEKSGLFDFAYYLETNPDVAAANTNPLIHYLTSGWQERRNPSPLFHIDYYLSQNTDVADAQAEPLLHFILHGSAENRNPHPLFDVEYYRRSHMDNSTQNPLAHFLSHSRKKPLNPHPLFDTKYYLQNCPDAKSSKLIPLIYYCRYGIDRLCSPHPLFDCQYYWNQYPDVKNAQIEPLQHFCTFGYREGRNPNPLFDIKFYLENNTDVKTAKLNPLIHFVTRGWAEKRDPSPRFSISCYLELNKDVNAKNTNPLIHYILYGKKEGRCISTNKLGVSSISSLKSQQVNVTDTFYEELRSMLQQIESGCDAAKFPHFSVILPTHNRDPIVRQAINSALQQKYPFFELVVVDDGSTDNTAEMIANKYATEIEAGKLKLIQRDKIGLGEIRNTGIMAAQFNWIAYLDSDNQWNENTLLYFAWAITQFPSYKTFYGNICQVNKSNRIVGQNFSFNELLNENFIDLNAYVHHKEIVYQCGSFDPSLKRLIDWDMIIRHTRCYSPVYLPVTMAQYYHCPDSVTNKENGLINQQIINQKQSRYETVIVLKVPAPEKHKSEWGDYHLARSMQTALTSMNYTVHLDCLENWYCERVSINPVINFVFRGLSRYRPSSRDINILWVLSHPDLVDADECNQFTAVLSASKKWLSKMSPDITVKCYEFDQFTDTSIFYPAPNQKFASDYLFVGNSRNIFRTSVKYAKMANLNVAVHGSLWNQFIEPKYIKGNNIPNDQLRYYYSSARMTLNDHWEDMAREGFVSNRIYDVTACKGMLISDHLHEIEDTYRSIQLYKNFEEFRSVATNPVATAKNLEADYELTRRKFSLYRRMKDLSIIIENLLERSANQEFDTSHQTLNALVREKLSNTSLNMKDIHLAADKLRWRLRHAEILRETNKRARSDARICIQIHAFHTDVLCKMLPLLKQIDRSVDLLISTDTLEKKSVVDEALKQAKLSAQVEVFENLGANIRPFLLQMRNRYHQYEYICHLHTKESNSVEFGGLWGDYLLRQLLSPFETIIHRFETDSDLGIYYPLNYPIILNDDRWNGNRKLAEDIFQKLEVRSPLVPASSTIQFPAGFMLWMRTKAVSQLFESFEAISQASEWKCENQFNGTYSHAIERSITQLSEYNGYRTCSYLSIEKTQKTSYRSRILLYVHFSANGSLENAVLKQLADLKQIATCIYVVSNSLLSNDDQKAIQQITGNPVHLRSNSGFDTGAWKDLIHQIGLSTLKEYDDVILMNDSCLGPIFQLNSMFSKMDNSNCHFWGITGHRESIVHTDSYLPLKAKGDPIPFHIQSYFLVYKKEVVESPAFASFWRDFQEPQNRNEAIFLGEILLTQFFVQNGFDAGVFIPESLLLSDTFATCINLPELYIPLGLPLLKRKILEKDNRYHKMADILDIFQKFRSVEPD